MRVVRPWLVTLAVLVGALLCLADFAWSVQFRPAEVLAGLARAADTVGLEGIAITLNVTAARRHRLAVRRLREQGAGQAVRSRERWRLASRLRDAALMAWREGGREPADRLLTEALQAAPERADLHCLRTDLRTRDSGAEERRMAVLRLVYEHDSACAHVLASRSFLAARDAAAATSYAERAARLRPEWSGAHLALARARRTAGDGKAAAASARAAMQTAAGLRERLAAAAVLRSAGDAAPSAWRVIAEHCWRHGWHAGVVALALLVFVVHPAAISGARSLAARLGPQQSISDSAS